MAAQAYTLYFAEVLSFCSNAAVGCHRTELNQTLLHVQKLTKFENGPKIWGCPPPATCDPKTTHSRVVLRRHINADFFGVKRAI